MCIGTILPAESWRCTSAFAIRACSLFAKLAASLESVLNRNLAASLTARQTAAGLEGLCMDIGVSASQPVLRLGVEDGRLRFGEPDVEDAGVTLSGDWRRLLQLLGGDHTGPGLDLRGDPAVAEGFGRLLKYCRPAPEEELARFTGEAFAHQAGEAARAATEWAGQAAGSLRRNLRDFVQEEARFAPTRVEFDAFALEVERLRDRAGRLAARIDAPGHGGSGRGRRI